ncbi:MAG: class I tRNA ligase family protein, partial [Candidatus Izemoplasmatales bacterium]
LRYFISTNSAPGLDLRYETEKVESSWNFINKLWNMSRYTLMTAGDFTKQEVEALLQDVRRLDFADRWILNKMNDCIQEADRFFETYDFTEAAKIIYNFAWNDFAAWYIEIAKLTQTEPKTQAVLLTVLEAILKLLHPFMPFVTEEIYSSLPMSTSSIMIAPWPVASQTRFEEAFGKDYFFEMIKAVRQIRNDRNVPYTKKIDILIRPRDKEIGAFFLENRAIIDKFLNPGQFVVDESFAPDSTMITTIFPEFTLALPLGSLVDLSEEIAKLEKRCDELAKELERSEKMLSNPSFVQKAPAEKVEAEKAKAADYKIAYEETKARLEELKN